MKIEKGMYVRTRVGRIEKVKTIEPYNRQERINGHTFTVTVKKASFNIIDLIEVDDYVNRLSILKINDIQNDNRKAFSVFQCNGTIHMKLWGEEDIESIVTHELFERITYKIGNENEKEVI